MTGNQFTGKKDKISFRNLINCIKSEYEKLAKQDGVARTSF